MKDPRRGCTRGQRHIGLLSSVVVGAAYQVKPADDKNQRSHRTSGAKRRRRRADGRTDERTDGRTGDQEENRSDSRPPPPPPMQRGAREELDSFNY